MDVLRIPAASAWLAAAAFLVAAWDSCAQTPARAPADVLRADGVGNRDLALRGGMEAERRRTRPTVAFEGARLSTTAPGAGAGATGFMSTNLAHDTARARTGATRGAGGARAAMPGRRARTAATPASPPVPARSAAQARRLTPQLIAEPDAAARLRRQRRAIEEDPFEALGLRAGSFVLRPAIEFKAGYDTNPARATNGRGSRLWTVAPEFALRSDWQRHEIKADIRGSYTEYDALHAVNNESLDAKVNGRIDVTGQTRIDLESRARMLSANPGNPDLPADLARLPRQTSLGTSAGLAQRFNRFELAAKGSLDRITWDPSRLTDGTVLSNQDRAYDQAGAQLRGSYELTPGVKPFVEVGFDTRRHDLAIDSQGIARDSTGRFVKAGTSFEITRKLTGEVAVGHVARRYEDASLPDLRGLLADASLVWSATALTTVKLTARTTAEETILPGVSGTLVRDAEAAVDHAFRRWLVGTVKAGFGSDSYVGSGREDHRFWTAAALTYKLSRNMQLKGEVRREWRHSNVLGGDYAANIFLAGIRLQR